jgi:hypothetical protein
MPVPARRVALSSVPGAVVVIGVASVLTVACSPTGGQHPAAPTGSATVSLGSSAPVSRFGSRAVPLAASVPGCAPHSLATRALAETAARVARVVGAQRPPPAIATCTIEGTEVVVIRFRTAATQRPVQATVQSATSYFATGPGWLAFTRTGLPVDAQESGVDPVAAALGGRLVRGGQTGRQQNG